MGQQATPSTERLDEGRGHVTERVRELVHEGNVRRIIIKNPAGATVIKVPVTVGVVGVVVAPAVAVIGTAAALAADYSIKIERDVSDSTDAGVTPSAS